jgi:hypothetical protein
MCPALNSCCGFVGVLCWLAVCRVPWWCYAGCAGAAARIDVSKRALAKRLLPPCCAAPLTCGNAPSAVRRCPDLYGMRGAQARQRRRGSSQRRGGRKDDVPRAQGPRGLCSASLGGRRRAPGVCATGGGGGSRSCTAERTAQPCTPSSGRVLQRARLRCHVRCTLSSWRAVAPQRVFGRRSPLQPTAPNFPLASTIALFSNP